MELSILIPAYKDNVVKQVGSLQRQCKTLEGNGLAWEIVVADDGSPRAFFEVNSSVAEMEGCRLLRRKENCGRSSTRNLLAREARYELLLYQDAGTLPGEGLVERFLKNAGNADVVCGSFTVSEAAALNGNLRCRYELRGQRRLTAARRNEHPYRCFHVNNFMVRRKVMLDNPFDETMSGYGYEDVLLGKELEKSGVKVLHIDNPVAYPSFEDNAAFLDKTASAIDTLYIYRDVLQGYSGMLDVVQKLLRHRLLWLPCRMMRRFSRRIELNLKSHNPSLLLFDLYRIGLLAERFYKV